MRWYALNEHKDIVIFEDLQGYLDFMRNRNNQISVVQKDDIHNYHISTVLLSTGRFALGGSIPCFETMVFAGNSSMNIMSDYTQQYDTYHEALENHKALVKCFNEGMIIHA